MKNKDKKITLDDLADELMFEIYQKMQFRSISQLEEGEMKKVFKKFFRKAIKINNKIFDNESTTTN